TVAHFVNYKDFGIDMPDNFPIHGIDVSTHQDKINWAKVKAMQSQNIKIGFVFIKATEGLMRVDNTFKYNWLNAHTVGIPGVAYHFFIAGKSGVLQAQNFIKTVQLKPGDLPPVVDVEELYNASPKLMREELKEYLAAIENYYQIRPIIYSYATFYNDYLGSDFDDYPLWVAHYFEEHKPRVSRHWDIWQHNEHGRVYGIGNDVDFSVFNGDSAAFNALLIK
ncbi:MAG TPA: GH25 family lysozyme, partial [Arachidicoccus sp.]